MTRCFVAIDLPDIVRERLVRVQDDIRGSKLATGGFSKPENLHVTIKFLGDVDDLMLSRTHSNLSRIEMPKFTVRLGFAGVFNRSYVRVIWVSVDGTGLYDLHERVDSSLSGMFGKEKHFTGHITLSRPTGVRDRDNLLAWLEKIDLSDVGFEVDRFKLKESILMQGGPLYKDIHSYLLR